MQRYLIEILNETGLHARPAAVFVQSAKRFQADIRLRNVTTDGDWADAKSVLEVLALGVEQGHIVELILDGKDELEASEAIQGILRAGLGEGVPSAPAPILVEPTPAQVYSKTFTGFAAAPGQVDGPVVVYREERLEVPRYVSIEPDTELARLSTARETAYQELERLKDKIASEVGPEEAAIFEAHQMFLSDSSLVTQVEKVIAEGLNAESAWIDGINRFAQQLEKIPDATLKARVADLRDVGQRVLRHLLGKETQMSFSLHQPSVILARDLSPSQTSSLPKDLVLGFCTAEGGPTSHSAILAKALGIPVVVGAGAALLELPNETHIILDGDQGIVIANPDEATLQEYRSRRHRAIQLAHIEQQLAQEPAITQDGHQVEVVANVGSLADAEQAMDYGAEGIGLLRTEFLYLDRQSAPGEDEQLEAYKAILNIMGSNPVVVRTLDVGGDKELAYLDLGREANPFLGWRAIRMCLSQPDFFKTQLRALLRASPGHDLRVMFPMITTLEELYQAKDLLEEARREVLSMGLAVGERLQIGIMVEVPSVAILADHFVKEVDFFSIGTNDLTQYTMAADRTNQKVAHLTDHCHPVILRQIHLVVDTAHQRDVWVGVCGEMAGDREAIPLLLGLGLDEFSMAPPSIPRTKAIIRQWSYQQARELAAEALNLGSAEEVRQLVRNYITKKNTFTQSWEKGQGMRDEN